MKKIAQIIGLLGACSAGWTGVASAQSYVSMPKLDRDSRDLQIQWRHYDGSTNGQMVVAVRNVGKKTRRFDPDGLFFVPAGDPEKAPQRLGAAGPFQIVDKRGGLSPHVQITTLKPGETKEVRLEVFCIDSHRSSPNSSTRFRVAKKRLPKPLRRQLKAGNQAILRKHKGAMADEAKQEIQQNMWKTRDRAWIQVEGERRKEK